MRKIRTLYRMAICLTGVMLIAFSVGAESQSKKTAPESGNPSHGSAEKGKSFFTSYGCYECHGRQAQGSRMSGPRLAPNPIAFPAFTAYVRQPRGQMPPYTSKVLSEQDLADIYAFLDSIPLPPSAKDIPLLK